MPRRSSRRTRSPGKNSVSQTGPAIELDTVGLPPRLAEVAKTGFRAGEAGCRISFRSAGDEAVAIYAVDSSSGRDALSLPPDSEVCDLVLVLVAGEALVAAVELKGCNVADAAKQLQRVLEAIRRFRRGGRRQHDDPIGVVVQRDAAGQSQTELRKARKVASGSRFVLRVTRSNALTGVTPGEAIARLRRRQLG